MIPKSLKTKAEKKDKLIFLLDIIAWKVNNRNIPEDIFDTLRDVKEEYLKQKAKSFQSGQEEERKTISISDVEFSRKLQSLEGMEIISPSLRVEIEKWCFSYIKNLK
jgi:histone H3/H4